MQTQGNTDLLNDIREERNAVEITLIKYGFHITYVVDINLSEGGNINPSIHHISRPYQMNGDVYTSIDYCGMEQKVFTKEETFLLIITPE